MRINLSPQQLSAFVQLARKGSFSAAARVQDVSQPALSRMVQQMEENVGRRLLDRTTRSARTERTVAVIQLFLAHISHLRRRLPTCLSIAFGILIVIQHQNSGSAKLKLPWPLLRARTAQLSPILIVSASVIQFAPSPVRLRP
jgi:molybdenum-dependent DNA-binding transcriptional regulator ModE